MMGMSQLMESVQIVSRFMELMEKIELELADQDRRLALIEAQLFPDGVSAPSEDNSEAVAG